MAGTSRAEQARNAAELAKGMRNLDEVIRAAAEAGVDGTKDLAKEAVSRIKDLLSRPYPPASQPGQPPAWRTGELRKSYEVFDGQGNTISFGSRKPYAAYLEFGTRYMRPRPHVRPVVKALETEGTGIIAAAIIKRVRETTLRKGGR